MLAGRGPIVDSRSSTLSGLSDLQRADSTRGRQLLPETEAAKEIASRIGI